MEKSREQLEKELEELKHREFMLNMVDTWDSSDYRYADELHNKIMVKKEEIEKCKQNSK